MYGEHVKECELTGADIPADMVRYTRTPLKKEDTRTAMEEIESMVGFSGVKRKLKNLLKLQGKRSKGAGREDLLDDLNLHMVLRGNPGVGKTTVAKLIGKAYKEAGFLPRGHVVKVTRADLVAGYVGQTAIKTQKVIERAMGGVLLSMRHTCSNAAKIPVTILDRKQSIRFWNR
ncbi:MAG: AAA family ATPase [Eubacterium ramulus]